jgi:integrase
MKKVNPINERLKRDYFIYLKHAKGKSESTIDAIVKALLRFEESTKGKDFKTFRREQAIAFKAQLQETKNIKSNEPLSLSTQLATLNAIKEFFIWLYGQRGYRAKIHLDAIQYFSLSDKEIAIGKAPKQIIAPTLEQVKHTIRMMPSQSPIERRNRALFAFAALTGIRDGALVSLCLKHFDVTRKYVRQEPDLVNTKFSKTIDTFLAPLGEDLETIVFEWVKELKEVYFFSNHDPLFPKTKLGLDENNSYIANGLEKAHWQNATPIRKIFKDAYERANLPYFHPHTLRHMLGALGQTLCKSPEEFKAWSQNFGHENVMTTFNAYGKITAARQGELIRGLRSKQDDKQDVLEQVRQLLNKVA